MFNLFCCGLLWHKDTFQMMSYCLFFLNDIGIISSNHTHLKTAFEKVQCLSSVAFHYIIFVLKIKKQLTPKTNKFIQPVIIQRIKNARTHTHTHSKCKFAIWHICKRCSWLRSAHTHLKTSFLVRVYLGSGICLWFKYSPLLTSLFTRVRTVSISSSTGLHRKHQKHYYYYYYFIMSQSCQYGLTNTVASGQKAQQAAS